MPMTKLQQGTKRFQHRAGFALLEILISFVVLAFGMLGIAGLILTSHKANASSYVRQQAIQSMSNIVDRIRANSATAVAGGYAVSNLSTGTIPSAPTADCSATPCSPAELSAYDKWYWLAKELAALPAGRGAIAMAPVGSNTSVTITVQWDDAPAQAKLGSSTSATGLSSNLSQLSILTLL